MQGYAKGFVRQALQWSQSGSFKLLQTEQISVGCADLLQLFFAISCLHWHCASIILTPMLLPKVALRFVSC